MAPMAGTNHIIFVDYDGADQAKLADGRWRESIWLSGCLRALSGLRFRSTTRGAEMSAFGSEADMKWCCDESPLLTLSGPPVRGFGARSLGVLLALHGT